MPMYREAETSILELLQEAEFLVDGKVAKKTAVLDCATWEELLAMLEDIEDADEVRRLRKLREETIPWERAKASLRAKDIGS